MRECWANVYAINGAAVTGGKYRTRGVAMGVSYLGNKPFARLHVRLKPEGAPRRYASEHDRRNWETYPEEMRKCPF